MCRRDGRRWGGFTLLELVIGIALLALIVGIALPFYLGPGGPGAPSTVTSTSNKAAVDEANEMADAWRTAAYSCYLQSQNASSCASNDAIGFTQPAGKYWNWTSAPVGGTAAATYAVVDGPDGTALTVSWPSRNAGLEQGKTYVVSVFVSGTSRGRFASTCLPVAC